MGKDWRLFGQESSIVEKLPLLPFAARRDGEAQHVRLSVELKSS
jgi:hypothetical protein